MLDIFMIYFYTKDVNWGFICSEDDENNLNSANQTFVYKSVLNYKATSKIEAEPSRNSIDLFCWRG